MRVVRVQPVVSVVTYAVCAGLVAVGCVGGSDGATDTIEPVPPPGSTAGTDPDVTQPAPPSVTTGEPWRPPTHRVGIRGGGFVDRTTGGTFVPRGVNYVDFVSGFDRTLDPDRFDPTTTAEVFETLANRGYNTVRIFLDTCQCASNESGFRPEFLDVVASLLQIADDHGLVVVLTSNDLPDIPYGDRANRGASEQIEGYRNAHVLTRAGHDEFVRYWDELLTGLVERQARLDAVLGWSLLNEQWLFESAPPLSLADGEVVTATGTYAMDDEGVKAQMVADNLLTLIDRTAATIRSVDPGALVTMGFFAPQFPNDTEIGAGYWVDTVPLSDSALDFLDLHAYPGGDLDVSQHAENFGITSAKPVLMGEVGAFRHLYPSAERAAIATQEWVAASCDAGWDGWLYWAYQPLPGVSDATWTMTAEDGLLLDALAPANQPDPCVPTMIDPDLARSGTASASRSLPDEPPEAAIDANPGTQWGAGDDAPQWIEVELATPSVVAEIRLHVAQFPDGPTDHRIDLFDAAGALVATARRTGDTAAGEILVVPFEPAVDDVGSVRITTTASVSWVAWTDVEVLGG